MKGVLTKVSDNVNALRTNEIEGTFNTIPTEGESFTIFGKSLTEGMDLRMVATSPIVNIEKIENGWRFNTLNSTYELTQTE